MEHSNDQIQKCSQIMSNRLQPIPFLLTSNLFFYGKKCINWVWPLNPNVVTCLPQVHYRMTHYWHGTQNLCPINLSWNDKPSQAQQFSKQNFKISIFQLKHKWRCTIHVKWICTFVYSNTKQQNIFFLKKVGGIAFHDVHGATFHNVNGMALHHWWVTGIFAYKHMC
jgi:hypothetical protein